jgi:hypothetical protein
MIGQGRGLAGGEGGGTCCCRGSGTISGQGEAHLQPHELILINGRVSVGHKGDLRDPLKEYRCVAYQETRKSQHHLQSRQTKDQKVLRLEFSG